MDQCADLTNEDTGGGRVSCDQAVFTSVRSPMGEGYRLIAASPGLSVDEKREMTQRSPSHDGLCESQADATGLASYPLSSGRHCVATSRFAGVEQSGRGGQRVYTHLVVLARGGYRRFGCDPFGVRAAVRAVVGDEVVLQSGMRLDPLALVVPPEKCCGTGPRSATCVDGIDVGRAGALLALVLEGRRVVIAGAPAAAETLEWIVHSLPRSVRESLAASYGLKLSPGRLFPLTFIQSGCAGSARMLRGRDAVHYDWESPPQRSASPFDAWVELACTRWSERRFAEMERLAGRVTEEAPAGLLQQIAGVSKDLEQAWSGGEDVLDALGEKYAASCRVDGVYGGLVRELQEVVAERRRQLSEQAACAARK